jgi:hypothetical protein
MTIVVIMIAHQALPALSLLMMAIIIDHSTY